MDLVFLVMTVAAFAAAAGYVAGARRRHALPAALAPSVMETSPSRTDGKDHKGGPEPAVRARGSEAASGRFADGDLGRLLDIADAIFVVLDHTGRIAFINRKGADSLCRSVEDLVGRDWFDTALAGEGREDVRAVFDRLMAGSLVGADVYENDIVDAHGQRHSVRWHNDILRDASGGIVGIFASGDDITEERRAETARRRSEAVTQAVFDAAVDGIITIDEVGIVTSLNRAAAVLFGYSAAEVIGHNVNMLMPEPYHSEHDGYLRSYRDTGVAKIIGMGREVVGRRKDGSVFPLDLSVSEGRVGGQRIFAGLVRDITGRRQAAEALREAKEDAERANLAKSKFLAAASHDLRQPIQALFFFVAALGRSLRQRRAEEHAAAPGLPERILADMERSLQALSMLLDSLLDISKLDAGAVVPQRAVVSLEPIFDRIAAEFGPAAAAKGLGLRMVGTRAVVCSDPVLLARILNNLVTNAIRYTETGRVLVGCRNRGATVQVWVCDTGIGIPADRIEEMFEEFTQLATPGGAERPRGQGLGLGLAIVRRLARLLDHPVSVSSSPGRGTTFAVSLPRGAAVGGNPAWDRLAAAAGSAAAAPAKAEPAEDLVLVIDDEPSVLFGLTMLIEDWGLSVAAAGSQEEAMALLTARGGRAPIAIVADYRLRQGRTGLEAVRAVRDHFESPIPAIIITGDTAPDRLREAQASGFSILHKPVRPDQLQTMLAAAIGGSEQRTDGRTRAT